MDYGLNAQNCYIKYRILSTWNYQISKVASKIIIGWVLKKYSDIFRILTSKTQILLFNSSSLQIHSKM